MRTYKKALIIVTVLTLVLFVISNTVLGSALINQFEGSISTSGTGAEEVKTKGGQIVGIIQVVGTIVAIGMLMILGIKYMLGSADQKAEYRKSMIPYLIGAVLIFGFSNITQVIYEWAKQI